MARYGSEKIRGHGIPEAIEAILFNKSRMSPKVAVLKPLSSGIAIGSGGPFGAEGPIIMTGGALGSLVGQFFRITGAERKTLLVAGAVAGMTAVFGTPIAAVMLAVELLLFECAAQPAAGGRRLLRGRGRARPLLLDGRPLFPAADGAGGSRDAGVLRGGRPGRGRAVVDGVDDALQGRRPVRPLPIHWMWWPRSAASWSASAAGSSRARWAWATTSSATCCTTASRSTWCWRCSSVQGRDVGRRARLGHVGRRAGAAADDGRGPGRAARPCCPAASRRCGRSCSWPRRWAA
jgi:hypothetical protein